MNRQAYAHIDPELDAILEEANDLHAVVFESDMDLRHFLAAALSYMPGWMRQLYRVRKYFVLLLGNRQEGMPTKEAVAPEDVPFTPGAPAAFFTVLAASEDRFWLAAARDKMIVGYLGVYVQPLGDGTSRFHFLSGARFLHWTARIYYAAILPFHHLVIRSMKVHALRTHARRMK